MERVSDEGTVRCVPSVVEVVGGSDGLKTEENSFPLRQGGIGKKYAGHGPPCQQGDGHHHVRCHRRQVLWTYTGRKALPLSTSLPVMGVIAGVNTASLGGYLHITKTRAR